MTTVQTARLDSLTGVRFFAALLVFGFHGVHYANTGELDVFSAGMVGVSLFYLLSGFVMAWTVREGDRPAAFYRRRFARIYPAFIAAWLLSLAMLLSRGLFEAWDLLPRRFCRRGSRSKPRTSPGTQCSGRCRARRSSTSLSR